MKLTAPFHLPALARDSGSADTTRDDGASALDLAPDCIERQIDSLLEARREHLARRPVAEIVDVVDRVARRFLAPDDPLREAAVRGIVEGNGLSEPMARRVLDGMAADWRAEPLRRTLVSDFGDPSALDRFVSDRRGEGQPARMVRAYGPDLTFHVFSGNVPGVSVTSLIRALLVKSASFGKTAAGEPTLAPLFARALAEEDVGLGMCMAVAGWPGGDETLETPLLARASAVVVYGSDATVEAIRRRIPARTDFHAYPHRFSVGIVLREGASRELAAGHAAEAAEATATFDQQGCTSPHVFYIEKGGDVSPREWAKLLADAMEDIEGRLPRGRLGPAESAAILQARGEAEIAQLAGHGHELHSAPHGTEWTVVYDPQPTFVPSCLNRTVRVKPLASADEVLWLLEPLGSALQTVGVAGAADRRQQLAERLGEIGATRVTSLARMPWPPPTWHHDGRPPLASLVRWCDLEDDSEADMDGTPLAPRGPYDA